MLWTYLLYFVVGIFYGTIHPLKDAENIWIDITFLLIVSCSITISYILGQKEGRNENSQDED